jgi:hypothetical protein
MFWIREMVKVNVKVKSDTFGDSGSTCLAKKMLYTCPTPINYVTDVSYKLQEA